MARAPKVYRMTAGFHDFYVAAPSQKAAIAAWGADKDVFRRGWAEEVDDPALTEEPLARPGEVVKRLRGSEAEQLAALGPDEADAKPAKARGGPAKPKPKPKPKPRPSRDALNRAEAALEEAEAEHEREREAIREREAALARGRAALEAKQAKERARLEERVERAAADYEAKLEKWRAG